MKNKRLASVAKSVERILEHNVTARGDDFVLVTAVYNDLIDIKIFESFYAIMAEHSRLCLPSFESITRARRKIQAKRPELRPEEKIQEKREELEEDYIEFARDAS